MMKTLIAGLVVSTLAFGAFEAFAATIEPAAMGDTAKGKIWVNTKGMTLYSFDKDVVGKSNCNDKCATEWPPLKAAADSKAAGDWTIVARDDGVIVYQCDVFRVERGIHAGVRDGGCRHSRRGERLRNLGRKEGKKEQFRRGITFC